METHLPPDCSELPPSLAFNVCGLVQLVLGQAWLAAGRPYAGAKLGSFESCAKLSIVHDDLRWRGGVEGVERFTKVLMGPHF